MNLGLIAGLLAGALWALVFVAPGLVAPYSAFDLALARYVIFGGISILIVLARLRFLPRLNAETWRISISLGFFGYASYYLAVAYAVQFGGTSLAAMIVGALPVLLAVIGNWRDKTLPWRRLAGPLTITSLGLVVINWGSFAYAGTGEARNVLLGLLLSLVALGLWIFYGLMNDRAARGLKGVTPIDWAALQGVGAAASMLIFIPVGVFGGLSTLPELGLEGAAAHPLILWAVVLGIGSSFIGTALWVFASKRLPVAITAQLIVFESLFAMTLGFVVERRWPHGYEMVAAALFFAGVIWGVRSFAIERERKAVLENGHGAAPQGSL